MNNSTNLALKQKHSHIGNIIDGSHAYTLHKISQATLKPLIFITHDHLSKGLYEEILFLNNHAMHFPAWDTPPYDLVSPSQEILQRRIKTLTNIIKDEHNPKIIVTSISSIIQKTIPRNTLEEHVKTLYVGNSFNRESLIEFLQNSNYRRVSTTDEPGEFSVRGSILDLFINGDDNPHRIDFFGNTIDSIKTFDSETQLTLESKKELHIIPTSELILSNNYIASFKEALLKKGGVKAYESELLENLQEGIKPNAIEQWLPLFYQVTNLLEYFDEPIIVLDRFLEKSTSHFFDKLHHCCETRKQSSSQPNIILSPSELWLTNDDYQAILENTNTITFELSKNQKTDLDITSIEDFKISSNKTSTDKFENLASYIKKHYKNQKNIAISASTNGSLERIKSILSQHEIFCKYNKDIPKEFSAHTNLILSSIKNGYSCQEYTLVTESDIFGQSLQNFRKKSTVTKNLHNELSSFSIGELVVHNEYGIGRFLGLETVELSNTKHDCIKIEYADNNKLFIPVENINLITKYGSDGHNVPLDSLGSSTWQIKKAKAKEKIKESAKYLIQIAAQRQLKSAEILEIDLGLYEEFCTTFQYVETDDQENAINAVIADLASGKAMDRLVCGDTGFGKTEVAIRAAFIAIKSGKQVALICPTTLLANQHFKVFKSRLEKFGIAVALLSRLITPTESKKTIANINERKINLVIGTHALLNDKIKFQDLGLLIIDEEQHFGVEQKEKLKLFKENIHVLTLSATPIPRTLQMSLVGIRDLSIIATPPINRTATKNVIMRFDEFIIKDALIKEKTRHGQSFYICPRITDLEAIEKLLSRITPELKFMTVHGRMAPTKIDSIMSDFCDGKFDVLLCTSIIESGIDIPRANTIIVHKSDMFGLGQLYQIRGRVGRSNIEAYAYFTFANNSAIKNTSLGKLEILQKTEHLGSGFTIASYDMDLRGYGNLVGEAQSGHIKEIGIELYQNILTEEIEKLKESETQNQPQQQKIVPQINLGITVLIPSDYVEDFDLRLVLYRRLGDLIKEDDVQAFASEMIDRFGPIPEEFENLLSIIAIKNMCYDVYITKIDANENGFAVSFAELTKKMSEKLFKLALNYKDKIQFKPNNKLVILKNIPAAQRAIYAKKLLGDIKIGMSEL